MKFFNFGLKPSLALQIDYFQKILFYLESDYPLVQALENLLTLPSTSFFKTHAFQWLLEIKLGQSHSNIWDSIHFIFKVFIQKGMESQQLALFLKQALELANAYEELKNNLIQASAYPIIVLIVSILLFLGLGSWLVPQLKLFFIENQIPLPGVVRLWSQAPIGTAIFIFLWGVYFLALKKFSLFQKYCLRLKKLIFRKFLSLREFQSFRVVPFLFGLESFLKLGWSECEAVRMSFQLSPYFLSMSNQQILLSQLKQGRSFYQAMAPLNEVPKLFKQQVHWADQSGQVLKGIQNLKKIYLKSQSQMIKKWSAWIEPALILLLGGLVAGLILGGFYPVLQSLQKIAY